MTSSKHNSDVKVRNVYYFNFYCRIMEESSRWKAMATLRSPRARRCWRIPKMKNSLLLITPVKRRHVSILYKMSFIRINCLTENRTDNEH